MSKFNTTNTMKTTNREGHVAYKMEDKLKLVTMVLTTMIGEPKFYGDTDNEMIQLAKTVEGEFLAKLAIYARTRFNLRSVSHVLATIVANREDTKPYIGSVIGQIVLRADDITEIMACQLNMYGKPIPNGLKKALAKKMNTLDEYQLAKYNGGNKAVKFKDILRITHVKPISKEQEELFGKILNDTLEIPYTWEVELSKRGNTKEVWEELIDSGKLGYMAMLRNLRNIINARVDNIDKVYAKLSDKEEVLKSKQLPFRFFSAYNELRAIATSKTFDTIEIAIRHSVENMSKLKGKTLIAIDTSGSMCNPISRKSSVQCKDIARLIGSLANYICEESEVVTFDTDLKSVALSTVGGIIQNALSIPVRGGGTDITLPIKYAIKEHKKFDRMIMISDNEINCYWDYKCWGNEKTTQSYVDEYRRTINPDFWVHAIDLQGYGTQQFIGGKTNIIAGWSERVLEFVDMAEKGLGNIVSTIENISL